MDIRPATAADVPQLLTLVRRYWEFEGIGGFAALRIELVLQRAAGRCGARRDLRGGRSRACCSAIWSVVLVMSIEHQGLMGEIDEFFVLPEARSRRTGTRLLAAAEAALTRRGCVRLQLQLGAANARARDFYQRRGYGARAGYELLDKALRVRAAGAQPIRSVSRGGAARRAAVHTGGTTPPQRGVCMSADRVRLRTGSMVAALRRHLRAPRAAPGPTATAMRSRTPAARQATFSATPSITRRKCCDSLASVPAWRSPTSSRQTATTASSSATSSARRGHVYLLNNEAYDKWSDNQWQGRLVGGRLPNVDHHTVVVAASRTAGALARCDPADQGVPRSLLASRQGPVAEDRSGCGAHRDRARRAAGRHPAAGRSLRQARHGYRGRRHACTASMSSTRGATSRSTASSSCASSDLLRRPDDQRDAHHL